VGAQRKEAQGLQWFLSESSWSPEEINRRRVQIMLEDPRTAPTAGGALVVDETGDRKDGKATAHVGKQYLGGIGKIAMELVERAVEMDLPFRAVVGDILYGEHREFKGGLEQKGIPYVLSLKPSHAWWHPIDEVGWVEGVAQAAYWNGPDDPGEWVELENAASATGTRRRGGPWKQSAGRSLWRRTGGWLWRPPILPRCRAQTAGT
jgi:SRSO17 transposase